MRLFNSIRRPMGGFFVDPGERQAEHARALEESFSHFEHRLDGLFRRVNRKMEYIMASLQEIIELVASQRTKIDSLNTLMDGVRDQIAQLLKNANTDQTTQQLVDQVFEKLKENSAVLDEAITENTPQATAGAVTPGPNLSDIKTEMSPATQPVTGVFNAPEPNPAPVDEPKAEAQG